MALLCAGVLCFGSTAAFSEAAPTQADALGVTTPAPAAGNSGAENSGAQTVDLTKVYAGSTPIPLDPIDMPTPTPRPELSFSYVEVKAERIGLKFDAPGTWTQDDTQADTFVLTDPNTLDNVNATLTIRVSAVASNYTLSNVKTDLANELSYIGQYNFVNWEASTAEKRTLAGKDGYYATFRGEQTDGTIIRGRVHMALLDGHKLLTVILKCPGWYNTSYVNVYTRFRNSVSILK